VICGVRDHRLLLSSLTQFARPSREALAGKFKTHLNHHRINHHWSGNEFAVPKI